MSTNLKIAINGLGRIGRCVLRAIVEQNKAIDIVAINEPADTESLAYLSQFDSTHGIFPGDISHDEQNLYINGKKIPVFHASKAEQIDWRGLDIDILFECSGQYSTRQELQAFIDAGCKRVLLSNPGKSAAEIDCTIVYGLNQNDIQADHKIVSAASCTTNAIVPVLDLLHQNVGVASAHMTTLHSVMNDQPLIDGYHNQDLRRTRSALQSMVPVATGLSSGVERLLPELKGLTNAKSIRVPILNVSAIDLSVNTKNDTSTNELIDLFLMASRQQSKIFSCVKQAYASVDFNHDSHSAIIDISQVKVNQGNFVNLLVWFDNEWGFANRMIDVAQYWAKSSI